MSTIVNNPPPVNDSGGGIGIIIGIIVILVLVFLFIIYGLPALRNVKLGAPQINVPSEIDVNINQTQ